ncbi:hypothetical protein NJ76_28250 [Rhodococcus sp. IITR03]|nr:hypothetical protein NJ76_28250 [Rhodococcus sp. IITR03]
MIHDVRHRHNTAAPSWDTLTDRTRQPELTELLDTADTDLRREYAATVHTLLREKTYGDL